MDRFLNVFVRPATVWKQLKSGMKFVFYQSHEDTGFVGGGKDKEGYPFRESNAIL